MNSQLGDQYDEKGKVNKPILLTGMKGIKFVETADKTKFEVSTDISDKADESSGWYNYEAKEWANAQTEDGSMWVWIPRFAYKTNSTGHKFDIKFLIGTTDQYIENGERKTARRAKSATEEIDSTQEYVVHPAFTNESSINYANGGWDKELTGIWVAKFEAGYASGNNSAQVKASSVNYSQAHAYVAGAENGGSDGTSTARNWLDGEYGVATTGSDGKTTYSWKDGKQTAIKYPTFQGKTYSMNYINHNDVFNIAKVLNEAGNIYGLSVDSDSHLMKNSEWGAVAYLGQSQYGLDGTNIYINNINLNNTTPSVYGVTGCASKSNADGGTEKVVTTTIAKINAGTQSNMTTWETKDGQKASSSGTVYGVYDMSGGLWERTAGYVANNRWELGGYGKSIAYNYDEATKTYTTLKTTSTKYTTVYPHDAESDKTSIESTDANLNTASRANYALNKYIFGDAIRETSTNGAGNSPWYNDYSYFPGLYGPFSIRGGNLWYTGHAGLFSFHRTIGRSTYGVGFRAVLVAV